MEDRPERDWFDDVAEDDIDGTPRRAIDDFDAPVDTEAPARRAADGSPKGGSTAARPRHKHRALKALLAALGMLLAVLLTIGGLYWMWVNNALDNFKRDDFAPTNTNRPNAPDAQGPQDPMTVVLLGSDSRGSDTGRSDTMMVAYLPANRQHVYLISIPRDTYVEIPNYGKSKINAAYSQGKVPLVTETLEKLFDVRMQHAVVIDFEGFIKLSEILDGIEVDNPEASTWGPGSKNYWPAGKITIKGDEALAFVRQRHELEQGDLTRAQRQRAVVAGIAGKALSLGVITNPAKFGELLDAVSKIVTVDKEFDTETIRNTALSMRIGSAADVRGIQIPLSGFKNHPTAGAIDVLDEERLDELREAMKNDTMDQYYEKHKDDVLVGQGKVTPSASPSPSAEPTK